MANTYNPQLASRISAGQSKQFIDYGESFSKGFAPGLNKAVASKAAEEKAEAEAAKKAAAAKAKQKQEADAKADKLVQDAINKTKISDKGFLENWKEGSHSIAESYRNEALNLINEERDAGPLDFNQKTQYNLDRSNILQKPKKLTDTLLRDTQVLGVLVEDFEDGSFSPVNPPDLKEKAAAILNTSKPIGEGLYEYELNGKKEKIDSKGLEDFVNQFNYVATADYENLFNEADKIAASTKVTKDGKVGYDFNQGKQLVLKGKIEQRLNDKDTGDDFLFDSLSNDKLKTGPIQDQTYKGLTKPKIIEEAKKNFGVTTDEEAIDKLKEFVSNSYVDLFKNAFPPLPEKTDVDNTDAPKNSEIVFNFIQEKISKGFEGIKELADEWKEDSTSNIGIEGSALLVANDKGEVIDEANLKDKSSVKNFLSKLVNKKYKNSALAQDIQTKILNINLEALDRQLPGKTPEEIAILLDEKANKFN